MRRIVRTPWVPLVLAALVFLPLVGRRDIVTSHEARVVQVARAMAESGWPWDPKRARVPQVEKAQTPVGERLVPRRDGATIEVNPWLVPMIGGTPRLQKPPLPYWCAAVLFRLFGVSAGAARIVPAILGALATLLMFDLARLLHGRRTAFFAALVWTSSYFVVDEFRKAMADPYLAFFVLATVTMWIRAGVMGSRAVLWLSYAALGFAALAKGPVPLVQVVPMLAAYNWAYRRPLPRKFLDHLVGVTVFAFIALPWPIAVIARVDHALEFFRYQSVGTFADNIEKARPWWFYLPNLLQIGLPWTPIELVGVAWVIARGRRRRSVALIALTAIVVIFSASHVKKNAYLLPIMPLLVLLAAQGLVAVTVWLRRLRWTTAEMRNYLLWISVAWCLAISLFLNAVLTPNENRRSPRAAATLALAKLKDEPGSAIWTPDLAEEASVYMPLDLVPANATDRYFAVVNSLSAEKVADAAEAVAHARPNVEPVALADVSAKRWQVYRVTFVHPVRVTQASIESGD